MLPIRWSLDRILVSFVLCIRPVAEIKATGRIDATPVHLVDVADGFERAVECNIARIDLALVGSTKGGQQKGTGQISGSQIGNCSPRRSPHHSCLRVSGIGLAYDAAFGLVANKMPNFWGRQFHCNNASMQFAFFQMRPALPRHVVATLLFLEAAFATPTSYKW
jgi:hypothetical protein